MGERPDPLAGEYTERDLADDTYAGTASVTGSDAIPEADYIEVEIDQTRAEMSETIDAIGERLSPAGVAERAREATIGKVENMVNSATYRAQDAGGGIAETIRSNPLPAALAGLGIGWLLVRSRQGSSTSRASYRTDSWAAEDATYVEAPGADRPSAGDIASDAGQRASDAASRASDAAARAGERVGDIAGRAQQRVGDVAFAAQDRAGQVATQARTQAERAREQVDRVLQENPLGIAAIAAAVGAGVGLVLPSTRREQELMGDARERVLDKAQHAAEQTMDRVQASAGSGNGSRGG